MCIFQLGKKFFFAFASARSTVISFEPIISIKQYNLKPTAVKMAAMTFVIIIINNKAAISS